MKNAPEPEDVELQNAVSDDGQLDLTYIKAAIRERLVDFANDGEITPDLRDEVITEADTLAEEVGEQAMQADTVWGEWKSREVTLTGRATYSITFSVTGFWRDHYFTGKMEMLTSGSSE